MDCCRSATCSACPANSRFGPETMTHLENRSATATRVVLARSG
jgi:hypothetical protein